MSAPHRAVASTLRSDGKIDGASALRSPCLELSHVVLDWLSCACLVDCAVIGHEHRTVARESERDCLRFQVPLAVPVHDPRGADPLNTRDDEFIANGRGQLAERQPAPLPPTQPSCCPPQETAGCAVAAARVVEIREPRPASGPWQ